MTSAYSFMPTISSPTILGVGYAWDLDTHTWACSIVVDPATEEKLGTIPEMGVEETKTAIAAAAKAFQTWGKTTAKVSSLVGASWNALTDP